MTSSCNQALRRRPGVLGVAVGDSTVFSAMRDVSGAVDVDDELRPRAKFNSGMTTCTTHTLTTH